MILNFTSWPCAHILCDPVIIFTVSSKTLDEAVVFVLFPLQALRFSIYHTCHGLNMTVFRVLLFLFHQYFRDVFWNFLRVIFGYSFKTIYIPLHLSFCSSFHCFSNFWPIFSMKAKSIIDPGLILLCPQLRCFFACLDLPFVSSFDFSFTIGNRSLWIYWLVSHSAGIIKINHLFRIQEITVKFSERGRNSGKSKVRRSSCWLTTAWI